jgi:hypothetical protein
LEPIQGAEEVRLEELARAAVVLELVLKVSSMLEVEEAASSQLEALVLAFLLD